MGRTRRFAAAWALLVVGACQRDEPALAPRPPPPSPPPPAVASAPAPSASASTTLDASVPEAAAPELTGDPGTLWVPALFRVGTVSRFRATDSVNTHDPLGGRGEWGGEVEVVICDVRWTLGDGGLRAVASVDFEDRPGDAKLAGLLTNLRVEGTASELVILGEPPLTLRRPRGAGRGRGGAVGCLEERGMGPYGRTKMRVCFDETGLTSIRLENLAGPRVVVATRVGPPTLDPNRCGG